MTVRPLLFALVLATGCTPSDSSQDLEVSQPESASPVGFEAVVGTGDGLTVIGADGTEVAVPFGMDYDTAVSTLMPYLGSPLRDTIEDGCPRAGTATLATWDEGLMLFFPVTDGVAAFEGWNASGSDERLQTVEGVQLGTPSDILDMTPTVERLDLEDEFAIRLVDGIGGYLDGSGPDALVAQLYGGYNCIGN